MRFALRWHLGRFGDMGWSSDGKSHDRNGRPTPSRLYNMIQWGGERQWNQFIDPCEIVRIFCVSFSKKKTSTRPHTQHTQSGQATKKRKNIVTRQYTQVSRRDRKLFFLSLILMSLIYGLIEHQNYVNVAESIKITADMRALCGCHWKLSGVSLSAIQVCENVAALKVNFGFSLSLQMERNLPL